MPTLPTARLERPLLLAWTVALALLVVLKFGAIPPALAWTLLPYLVLMARRLIAPDARETETPERVPRAPVEADEPEAAAESPERPPEMSGPDPEPIPTRPASPRPRRRPRPRLAAEPSPAAWVEVAPGRFVRGEPPEPTPPSEAPEPTPIPEGESSAVPAESAALASE